MKSYKKLFDQTEMAEPSPELFTKIISRIHSEKKILNLKRRLIIFSLGLIISAVALVPAFNIVRADFNESGFSQFFSLLFSDFGAVLTYWQSFTLTLLESLPVMSIAVFLFIIFIFFESLKFLARDMKIFLHASYGNN
jgi:hypothetical protein